MSAAALRRELLKLRAQIGDLSADVHEIDDPASWAQRVSGLTLDGWQRQVLESGARRLMLLASRQSGKTETVSLLSSSIAARGGAVIVIAPSLRQSANLFLRMRSHLQRAGARLTRETTTEISLAGGGWATCLPGDRPSMLRGLSLRHAGEAALVIDEAAFVKEELWPTASPMLAAAPNARLIMLTTPCGPTGEFHRAFTDDEFEAERITVKATDCPRISPQFLEEEKRRLGAFYLQEYFCEFVASGASVFSADALAAMFARDITPSVSEELAEIDWGSLLDGGKEDAAPRRKLWSF